MRRAARNLWFASRPDRRFEIGLTRVSNQATTGPASQIGQVPLRMSWIAGIILFAKISLFKISRVSISLHFYAPKLFTSSIKVITSDGIIDISVHIKKSFDTKLPVALFWMTLFVAYDSEIGCFFRICASENTVYLSNSNESNPFFQSQEFRT